MLNIDQINFTPVPAFTGGILIGIAIIIFFVSNGRLAGVSGILNNALTKTHNFTENILFLIGLILGPLIYMIFFKASFPFVITSSVTVIIFGGLLVGIGTKIGSGCTSGHGVCGISLFSVRSIIATFLFIVSAMITVFIFKWIGLS